MKVDMKLAYQNAKARGNMYRFFSTVYLHPPNVELLHQIVAKKEFLEELSVLFGKSTVAALREFATTVDIDKDLSSLEQEYMNLFAVPTGRYVTPFEDVYRGKTGNGQQIRGPLLGECAIRVRRMYRAAGTEMEKTCKELSTHIGVELSFMSFLCEMEAEAIANQEGETYYDQAKRGATDFLSFRELQIKFLQEHLNEWFPQLSKSIQANSRSQLYRSLAIITEKFLGQDTKLLLAMANSEKCIPDQNIL